MARQRQGIFAFFLRISRLLPGPDLEQRIPRACTQTNAVIADSKTADPVLVTAKRANFVASENIPHLALKIVITSEKQSSRDGESNGSDATQYLVALVNVEFTICTNVEETAGSIIRARAECISVGEELDSIDVRFVSGESLNSLSGTNIPEFRESIAGARDEDVLVGRVNADRHDVAQVVGEFSHFRARFNIPQHASHVSGRGDNTAIVDEAAAREVSRMS